MMPLPPSRGAFVCRWVERQLVHGEGDRFGQPFRLTRDERRFIYRLHELRPDGRRRYRRALMGRPKGYGKTELAAALGCVELGVGGQQGLPASPLIPVAAGSFEQADLLFGSARTMISEGPLRPFFDVFDTEILRKDGPGRMYRVAAAAGTNDGQRPTFFLADEVHEWVGRKERVHLILSNGLAKRQDGCELNITTAGADAGMADGDPEKLAGRLYEYGKAIERGDVQDDAFLFDWTEAASELDLADEEQLETAIRQANPHVDLFGLMDQTKAKFEEIPEFEFRRYYLNQWTTTAESWLPRGAWEACRDPEASIPAGAEVVIGVDIGTVSDTSAIVVLHAREDGRVVAQATVFEPTGSGAPVELATVDAAIHAAARRYHVQAVVFDEWAFERSAQDFSDMGLLMVKQPQSVQRMSTDSQRLYDAIVKGRIVHDGDPVFASHVRAGATKQHESGWRLVKNKSRMKIDALIALAIAFGYLDQQTDSVYEHRGLLVISMSGEQS
jgi:phage terminase large subunit-like protein